MSNCYVLFFRLSDKISSASAPPGSFLASKRTVQVLPKRLGKNGEASAAAEDFLKRRREDKERIRSLEGQREKDSKLIASLRRELQEAKRAEAVAEAKLEAKVPNGDVPPPRPAVKEENKVAFTVFQQFVVV